MLTSCWPGAASPLVNSIGMPACGHQVAELAVDRFGLGRLQQVVVLVVPAEAVEADEALASRPPRRCRSAGRTPTRSRPWVGSPGSWRAPRRAAGWCAARPGSRRRVVDGVGEDEGGLLQPGDDAQGGPVRVGDVVAVAGLPVHELEAVRRIHLHVGAEQVGAEVGAVLEASSRKACPGRACRSGGPACRIAQITVSMRPSLMRPSSQERLGWVPLPCSVDILVVSSGKRCGKRAGRVALELARCGMARRRLSARRRHFLGGLLKLVLDLA